MHPLLYRITVVGTKGGTFPLLSAVKHKGDSYFLQHDHDTHVAWTGKHVAAAATGQEVEAALELPVRRERRDRQERRQVNNNNNKKRT